MSDFKRTFNPQVLPTKRIRAFEGIGGKLTQVLTRKNYKGWDISDTVANLVEDLSLDELGTLRLRSGCVKLNDYSYDINWIGQITIGGITRVGLISNGKLDLIPWFPYEDIPLEEEEEKPTLPADYPSGWRRPRQPIDDVPLASDPSLPVEEQICEANWTWGSDPDSFSYTMWQGEISSTAFNWYIYGEGFRPWTAIGAYNSVPSWMTSSLIQGYSWDVSECKAFQWTGIAYTIETIDDNDNLLDAGNYSFTGAYSINDGTLLTTNVSLTVKAVKMLLDGQETSIVKTASGHKNGAPVTFTITMTSPNYGFSDVNAIPFYINSKSATPIDIVPTHVSINDMNNWSGETTPDDYGWELANGEWLATGIAEGQSIDLNFSISMTGLEVGTYIFQVAPYVMSESASRYPDRSFKRNAAWSYPNTALIAITVDAEIPVYTGNLKVTVVDHYGHPPDETTYIGTYEYNAIDSDSTKTIYRNKDETWNYIEVTIANGDVACFISNTSPYYLRHPEYQPWVPDYSPSADVLRNPGTGCPEGEFINNWRSNAGGYQMVSYGARISKVTVEQL